MSERDSLEELFPIGSLEHALCNALTLHNEYGETAIVKWSNGTFDAIDVSRIKVDPSRTRTLVHFVDLSDWLGPDSGLEDGANVDADSILSLADKLDPDNAIARRAVAVHRIVHPGEPLADGELKAIVAWLKTFPDSVASYEIGELAKEWLEILPDDAQAEARDPREVVELTISVAANLLRFAVDSLLETQVLVDHPDVLTKSDQTHLRGLIAVTRIIAEYMEKLAGKVRQASERDLVSAALRTIREVIRSEDLTGNGLEALEECAADLLRQVLAMERVDADKS